MAKARKKSVETLKTLKKPENTELTSRWHRDEQSEGAV
jgi:hypothetical protein